MSESTTNSALVRSHLIQALTLDLVGPTPGILAQLELDGRTEEAAELRAELLDRPPNRWYQNGFVIPSETRTFRLNARATPAPMTPAPVKVDLHAGCSFPAPLA
jgi:hypothetical protein